MAYSILDKYIVPVIKINGKFFGSLEKDAFIETVEDLKARGTKSVVVDLSNTKLIDSTGIGVLIAGQAAVKEGGGAIRIAGLERRIRAIFMMTKLLGTVFEEYETVEAAVQSFRDRPPIYA